MFLPSSVFLLLAFLLFGPVIASAQFEARYDIAYSIEEYGKSIKATPDGGSICVGNNTTNSNLKEAFIAKLDPDGTVVWMREYPAISSQYDYVEFTDIVLVDDNSVNTEYVVTGSVRKPGVDDKDILVARISSTGQVVWSATYQSPYYTDGKIYNDEGLAVIKDLSGYFAVTGYTNGEVVQCGNGVTIGERADLFLLRVKPDGTMLSWTVVGENQFGGSPITVTWWGIR